MWSAMDVSTREARDKVRARLQQRYNLSRAAEDVNEKIGLAADVCGIGSPTDCDDSWFGSYAAATLVDTGDGVEELEEIIKTNKGISSCPSAMVSGWLWALPP